MQLEILTSYSTFVQNILENDYNSGNTGHTMDMPYVMEDSGNMPYSIRTTLPECFEVRHPIVQSCNNYVYYKSTQLSICHLMHHILTFKI